METATAISNAETDLDSQQQQQRLEQMQSETRQYSQTYEKEDKEPKHRGCFARVLEGLDCIRVGDDGAEEDEINPFSKRRLVFVAGMAVLAVLVNLIVVPLVLANLNDSTDYDNVISYSPTITMIPRETSSTTSTSLSEALSPISIGPVPTISVTPSPTTNEPTISPTKTGPAFQIPTLTRTQEPTRLPIDLEMGLPLYTTDVINDTPNSPQAKAYNWLLKDPNFDTYSSSRKRQRMALATLFYATNQDFFTASLQDPQIDPDIVSTLFQGNDDESGGVVYWTNADGWLSYNVHECFWFSRAQLACDINQQYRYLALQKNNLVGQLPLEIGFLTNLEQLQLSDNLQIYGTLPTTVNLLTNLRALQMSNLPQLAGSLPSEIGNLHASLQTIDLRDTPFFIKRIATEIGRLVNCRQLLLGKRFSTATGTTTHTAAMPSELGMMKSLGAFTISGEEVLGILPTELATLSQLQWLSVTHTKVTGPIPHQLGSLSQLATLDLANNRLSSTLPMELGRLQKSLTSLSVNDNALTGTIPVQYSDLTNCKTMLFQNNQLEGSVPVEVCFLLSSGYIDTVGVDCKDSATSNSSGVGCNCSCECF